MIRMKALNRSASLHPFHFSLSSSAPLPAADQACEFLTRMEGKSEPWRRDSKGKRWKVSVDGPRCENPKSLRAEWEFCVLVIQSVYQLLHSLTMIENAMGSSPSQHSLDSGFLRNPANKWTDTCKHRSSLAEVWFIWFHLNLFRFYWNGSSSALNSRHFHICGTDCVCVCVWLKSSHVRPSHTRTHSSVMSPRVSIHGVKWREALKQPHVKSTN